MLDDHICTAVDADYAELQRKMKIMDGDRQKFAKHADGEMAKESRNLDTINKENSRLQKEVTGLLHRAPLPSDET